MKDQLKFRELYIADKERIYEIYSDTDAMKFRGSKPMQSIEDAKNYIQNQRIKQKDILTIRKGIVLEKSNELIGSVMFKYNLNKTDECEIGYSIGKQFWGQGLGEIVVVKIIETLELSNDISSILAWTNIENKASVRILEKVGFERSNQSVHLDCYLYRRILSPRILSAI